MTASHPFVTLEPNLASRPARLDPYRLLFLIGMGHALAGTLLWLLAATSLIGYPGMLHRILMIEGFEQSFIAGFLLTAIGGITHGGRTTKPEMAFAAIAQVGVGGAALLGSAAAAHGFFLASMLVLLTAAVRRLRRGQTRGRPPRELIFIVTALLLGLTGGVVLVTGARASNGLLLSLGTRLLSHGEVLTLVVGVGSMLVPSFLGHRITNVVPTAARPWWQGRAGLYLAVALILVGSLGLEVSGLARLAAAARAIAVSAILLGVWRIHRGETKSRLALVLRTAGFAILTGLWIAFLVPSRPLLGEHVLFVGGYGLLTMGIATRVIVGHGSWPQQDEARLLHPVALLTLAMSMGFRMAAELVPAMAPFLWAASGTLWSVAWLSWGIGAVPRILMIHRAASAHSGGRTR